MSSERRATHDVAASQPSYERGLHLDFILDHLNGCKWHCSGCGVDKSAQDGWASVEDGPKTLKLMRHFQERGWVLDHLELAPTDFMTASNTARVLRDPAFQELTRMYRSTLLQTTFLSDHQQPAADLINETFDSDQVVNFFVVLNANQLKNEKYLDLVITNKNRFLDKLKVRSHAIPHPLLNAFVHKDGQGFNDDFIGYHQLIRQKWGRSAYHTFSCGRSFHNEASSVLAIVDWLNEKFDAHVNEQNAKDVGFYYSGQRDGLSKHYVYKMGKWFHVPILYSPFVNEYPELEIKLKELWSADQFEAFEEKLISDQFNSLDRKSECASCFNLYQCAQYGLLKLQDVLGVNRCIVPRQAVAKARGVPV